VAQTSPSSQTLDQVVFKDANNGYALGVMGPNPVVFTWMKTTNGGATWINETSSTITYGPFSMFFTDANNGYAGGVDAIYKTTNGGSSWTQVTIPHSGASFAVFSLYFFDANVGYACGWDYVNDITYMLHTSDAGASWSAVVGGTAASIGSRNIDCLSASTCYVVGWNGASGGGVYKTLDAGATWTLVSSPPFGDLRSIDFFNASTGLAAAGGYGIIRSTDGGLSWTQVTNTTAPNYQINSVSFIDATTAVAVGDGVILVSGDAGLNWTPMSTPTFTNTNQAINSIHFPTSNVGYAVGEAGTILKYNGSVGVQELKNSLLAQVYPNPSNGEFTVKAVKNFNSIEVLNVTGEKVYSAELNGTELNVNLEDQPKGIYFYRLTSSNNTVKTGKLIIQ
jgi:photosystem II stability/assembly factor-like uncharacterized protein